MAKPIDNNFNDGTLQSFTAFTGGTTNTVAHSTDIDHTPGGAGATPGSVKLDFISVGNGTAYIENTNATPFTGVDVDLWITFHAYFDSLQPVAAKKASLGGGNDWRFFDLRDDTVLVFSIYADPAVKGASVPKQGFSFFGRWEQATIFDLGHVDASWAEANMWHRFWVHFKKGLGTVGLVEWGMNNRLVGQSGLFNTNTYDPDFMRLGSINVAGGSGRPVAGNAVYLDDIKWYQGTTDTQPIIVADQNPFGWARVK